MAKREVIELLRKYVILLNSEGISVNRAFLFGSYSNDTASDSSDIDVMIVFDKYDESDDDGRYGLQSHDDGRHDVGKVVVVG